MTTSLFVSGPADRFKSYMVINRFFPSCLSYNLVSVYPLVNIQRQSGRSNGLRKRGGLARKRPRFWCQYQLMVELRSGPSGKDLKVMVCLSFLLCNISSNSDTQNCRNNPVIPHCILGNFHAFLSSSDFFQD